MTDKKLARNPASILRFDLDLCDRDRGFFLDVTPGFLESPSSPISSFVSGASPTDASHRSSSIDESSLCIVGVYLSIGDQIRVADFAISFPFFFFLFVTRIYMDILYLFFSFFLIEMSSNIDF